MRMTDNSTPPEDIGMCILMFGPTSSGKSRSTGTAIPPIYHVNKEDKPVKDILIGCPKEIYYFEPDDMDDELATVNSWVEVAKQGKFPARTVVNDGITFSQVKIKQWLEESRKDERMKEQKYRGAIDYARSEVPDIGVNNSIMIRILMLYNRLSKYGVTVIFTATEELKEGVYWPTLNYREVPNMIHGVFNHIGRIVSPFHYDEEGNAYPPLIAFAPGHDPNGYRYISRSSSDRLMKAGAVQLHWTKIINLIREEQRQAWEAARKG